MNELTTLATEINQHHEQAQSHAKSAIEHALACGDSLIEAKAQVKHGEWLPWLEANTTIRERTASQYMRVARNKAELESKTADYADLTIKSALDQLKKEVPNRVILLPDAIFNKLKHMQSGGVVIEHDGAIEAIETPEKRYMTKELVAKYKSRGVEFVYTPSAVKKVLLDMFGDKASEIQEWMDKNVTVKDWQCSDDSWWEKEGKALISDVVI